MKIIVSLFFVCGLSVYAAAADAPGKNVPEYNLSVTVDIAASKIMGVALIRVSSPRELVISVGHLHIKKIIVDGVSREISGDEEEVRLHPKQAVQIVYERIIEPSDESVIDHRGIILTSCWYPSVKGFCIYRLKVLLPKGYQAVSEAEHISSRTIKDKVSFRFDFPHALREEEGVSLIASDRFVITKDRHRNVDLFAYFLKEDAHLAPKYLAAARQYIAAYEKKLTPFPYPRFAIVESFLPSAFSLPTFILMSREELLLPSIERTALGHEIVHQWFGNSVFSNYDSGNWNEGFTIYFADHFAQEQKGKAWQCRRRILSGFQSIVSKKNDFPLAHFTEREDDASRMIGYGKSAMVVHMLRKLSGDRLFSTIIRDFITQNSFKKASWDDIRAVFEKHLKRDLRPFFSQWIQRPGMPSLEILDLQVSRADKDYWVSFAVLQKTAPYRLQLPVTIHYKGGVRKKLITLEQSESRFSFKTPGEPLDVVIDEEYDLLRVLLPEENPPTLERLLTDDTIVIIPPPSRKGMYRDILETFTAADSIIKRYGYQSGYGSRLGQGYRSRRIEGSNRSGRGYFAQEAGEITDADLSNASLVVLGGDNPLLKNLFGDIEQQAGVFSVSIRRNPRNNKKMVAIVNTAERTKTTDALKQFMKTPFYSHYTLMKDGRIDKRLDARERGIRIGLHEVKEK